jgi:hypothetical protein
MYRGHPQFNALLEGMDADATGAAVSAAAAADGGGGGVSCSSGSSGGGSNGGEGASLTGASSLLASSFSVAALSALSIQDDSLLPPAETLLPAASHDANNVSSCGGSPVPACSGGRQTDTAGAAGCAAEAPAGEVAVAGADAPADMVRTLSGAWSRVVGAQRSSNGSAGTSGGAAGAAVPAAGTAAAAATNQASGLHEGSTAAAAAAAAGASEVSGTLCGAGLLAATDAVVHLPGGCCSWNVWLERVV